MGDADYSNKYEGMDLCTIADVEDEIGPVLSKQSTTVFPDNRRDQIVGRWIAREQAKFYQFVGIRFSDLRDNYLELARDCVLFRVVIRVLRKIQANRTQRSGGVPSYQELIVMYSNEQDMIEHHLETIFRGTSKGLNEPFPASFNVYIEAIDDTTEEAIPGARIYVDNEWLSTTWKDGKVNVPLESLDHDEDGEVYDVQLKAVGYTDSEVQEIYEAGTYVFRLVPS